MEVVQNVDSAEGMVDSKWAAVYEPPSGYGWAAVDGETFGTTVNKPLRKPVKTTVIDSQGYQVGQGILIGEPLPLNYANLVLPISNDTQPLRCGIKTSIAYKTASGAEVPKPERDRTMLFYGSSGILNGEPGSNCLGPGETGYVLYIEKSDDPQVLRYEQVAEIEVSITADEGEATRPEGLVVATGYDKVMRSDITFNFEITYANRGESTVVTEQYRGFALLLDDGGLPVDWTGFLGQASAAQIGPGESFSVKAATHLKSKVTNIVASFLTL